jgi:predicted RNase H-like HicB family nuclease
MRLQIRIFKNDYGTYTAVCVSLPGCMSRGQTPQEAEELLDEAIRGYMAALNNFVPERLTHDVVQQA